MWNKVANNIDAVYSFHILNFTNKLSLLSLDGSTKMTQSFFRHCKQKTGIILLIPKN